MTTRTSTGHHYVYMYVDAEEKPLYVGMTVDPKRRDQNHRNSSAFAPFVADRAVYGPMPFEEAQRIEAEALIRFRPPYNKALTNGYRWPEPTEEDMERMAHVLCTSSCVFQGDEECAGVLTGVLPQNGPLA